jgi:AraC family transcriptional regulator
MSLTQLTQLTGPITSEQLRHIDCFSARHMAMFMPIAGPCMLAISPMHTHPAHMFVVNFSDTTSIVLKHIRYRAQPNTVSYLPPNVPHHEVNETGIPRYVAIMVEPAFWEEQAKAYSQYKLELDGWKVFPAPDELLSVIKRFIGESKAQKAGADMLLEALSVETAHLLLRSMLGLKANGCVYVSRMEINRSIEYMRQNLSEKLTLASLACFSGMSVSHFARIFRQETGLSPIEYLIDMRLEVACRLLLGKSVPFKQIAMDCGFSSPAHFSASFQKKYQMAPSEYLHTSSRK